jgi:predicted enzyme related to lactoylglutathione lyase
VSERDQYQPGVPCWVDTLVPDPAQAREFYGRLFGWEFEGPGPMPGDPPGEYFVARVRGRDVAGIGSQPPDVPAAAWNTHISVSSADEAAEAARRAGGRVITPPFDASPAGRLAVLADPSGAAFCVWQPLDRQGAQVVNEPSAWAMSVLHSQDPDAAKSFYAEMFGWESEPFGPGMALCRLPGYVGGEPAQPVPRDVVAAMAPLADDTTPAHWSVGFWVEDAERLADVAPGLGGRVIAAPFDAGGMTQAVLADPYGAAFAVTTAPRH